MKRYWCVPGLPLGELRVISQKQEDMGYEVLLQFPISAR